MSVPYATVLCPTDASSTGNLAVPIAFRLCGDHGTVHLLHICEPPYLGNPMYGPFVQGYVPTPQDTAAGEKAIMNGLKSAVPSDALKRGIRTQFHVVHGVEVAREIEEHAKSLAAEVIVLGTHGRTGLGRILMGSVATDVVKRKTVPVVLVHHDVQDGK